MAWLSDIEIAQSCTMRPIGEIAEKDRYYRDCAVYFGGEKAADLLSKLEVVDAEYENAENELEANRMRAESVAEELAAVNERLYAIVNRTLPVSVGDRRLSYKEVVAKAEADYLKAINDEIAAADERKEQAKAKLQATRRVVDEAKAEESDGKERLLEMRAALSAAQQAHDALYNDYVPRFEEIGLKTPDDIERIIMSEDELAAARETLYKYCDYAERLGQYGNSLTLDDGTSLRFTGYEFVRDMAAFCYDYGIAGILSVCPHYDASGSLSLANAIKEAMQ